MKHIKSVAGMKEVEAEIKLLCILCEIAPADFEEFSLANFALLGEELKDFLSSAGLKPA